MAQKGIREFDAKNLIAKYLKLFEPSHHWDYTGFLITPDRLHELDDKVQNDGILIVKPDMLFGKRGKNNLIFKAFDATEAKKWITEKASVKCRVKKSESDEGIEGNLTHFLIEPYIPHEDEYYLSINTERDNDVIFFSTMGGVDVEENWDKVIEIKIPFTLENKSISEILNNDQRLNSIKPSVIKFISNIYQFFKELNFSYLELNPFVEFENRFIPLDVVARLDTTAEYQMSKYWGEIEFPKPFGTENSSEELTVEELDTKSGASLKLTVLNPNGKVWLLTAGGGASLIYADTVAELGGVDQLGNIGEYSGNPTENETEVYCDNLFNAMFRSNSTEKILIIGGAISNFTDVASTFKGIIKAIEKRKDAFVKSNIHVFIRRGGPRYKIGLELISRRLKEMNIPVVVNGPETHMTRIVKEALMG